MKFRRQIMICVVVLCVSYMVTTLKSRTTYFSGIPDVVSCIVSDDDYYLTVVSNSSEIEDQDDFIEQIVEMFEENRFHSMVFSYNKFGRRYHSLHVSVYLHKDDIRKANPEFVFNYRQD